MSDWAPLTKAWSEAQANNDRALLFTLIDVVGSSYRKVGAHMLATRDGIIAGSVSAGCIEADLVARLDELFDGTLPQILSYTNINEDEYALNRGCNGDICIYVEELHADQANSISIFETARDTRQPQVHAVEVKDLRLVGGSRLFVERILPPLRVIIFGNQRDSEPLAKLVTSVDAEVSILKKSQLDALNAIQPDERTAIVIMSHDFERDRDALLTVASKSFPYVGIMGPKYRTEEMLKGAVKPVRAALHYPIGINIRAEGSSEIAVSVIAEIIQTFKTKAKKIATVVLAAGEAKRFGSPKQLAKLNGQSLIRRATIQALLTPNSAQTAVVIGSYSDQITEELAGLRVTTIENTDWKKGMGSSIAAAARWAKEQNLDGLVFVACDQVELESAHIAAIISAANIADIAGAPIHDDETVKNATIVAAQYHGAAGIPTYFDKTHFDELETIEPEAGAKAVISNHRESTVLLAMEEAHRDIDTREQLEQLERELLAFAKLHQSSEV